MLRLPRRQNKAAKPEIQNKKNPGGFLHQAVDVFLRVLQEMPNQSIAELTGQQIRKLILEMIQRLPQVWSLKKSFTVRPFWLTINLRILNGDETTGKIVL